MGSSLSKPLENLQVEDIMNFVAAMGSKYRVYLKDIEENGIKGELLAELKDDQDFEDTVLDALDIKNKLHRRALLIEWNNAKTRQGKKRKLLENTQQEQVDLTNTDIFHCPSKVPLPPFEKDKKPFMASQGWLNRTRDVLLDNMNLKGGVSRPLPMAFVRCSRGGKTRATTEVIHLISSSCAAVYVSFNNESPMELQGYVKRPLEELCDRIGFAARKGDLLSLAWLDFRDRYKVNPESVGTWLAKEKCILFVDELNLLPEVSVEVANFLKTLFLVDEGRCFCFSSHLATTSTAVAAFLPNESNREIVLRTLPLIPSLETARTALNTPAISAREALYYGLIPGLLVERYKGRAPHLRRTTR